MTQLEQKIANEFDEKFKIIDSGCMDCASNVLVDLKNEEHNYSHEEGLSKIKQFLLSALAEQKSEIVKMLQNCKLPVNSISKDGSSTLAYIPNEGFNRELNNRLDFIITNLTKE